MTNPRFEAEARLVRALSAEMQAMRSMVEALAVVLVSDPEILDLYGTELQTFDLLAQKAMESACLLERIATGMAAEEAVAAVRLERMQERLRDALKAA